MAALSLSVRRLRHRSPEPPRSIRSPCHRVRHSKLPPQATRPHLTLSTRIRHGCELWKAPATSVSRSSSSAPGVTEWQFALNDQPCRGPTIGENSGPAERPRKHGTGVKALPSQRQRARMPTVSASTRSRHAIEPRVPRQHGLGRSGYRTPRSSETEVRHRRSSDCGRARVAG